MTAKRYAPGLLLPLPVQPYAVQRVPLPAWGFLVSYQRCSIHIHEMGPRANSSDCAGLLQTVADSILTDATAARQFQFCQVGSGGGNCCYMGLDNAQFTPPAHQTQHVSCRAM